MWELWKRSIVSFLFFSIFKQVETSLKHWVDSMTQKHQLLNSVMNNNMDQLQSENLPVTSFPVWVHTWGRLFHFWPSWYSGVMWFICFCCLLLLLLWCISFFLYLFIYLTTPQCSSALPLLTKSDAFGNGTSKKMYILYLS